ncbi:MAG: hypothetical protein HY069_02025 [Chlamydiia bacterium]|nr:hypothetical protein [Chlamydiia bacterium]
MDQPLFKKPVTPNFSDPATQLSFVEQTKSSKELMQKELDVNQSEQILLKQRIQMMEEFVNDLPSTDPQYSILSVQIKMDQVELDELKIQEQSLHQKLSAE